MSSTSVRCLAMLAGMALAAAACGSQTSSPSASGVAPGTGSASPTATRTCSSGKPAPSGGTLTIGSRDNGATFCLRVGQQVMVYLRSSPARPWRPIHSDSSTLRPIPNGRLMLMRGVTGAAFAAARPGTARITSARPTCTRRPVRCDAMIEFHVTLVIGAPPK